MSSYEMKVLQLLKSAGLRFEREKTFADLRGGRFRYDFFITSLRGRPICIEVQGEQHYQMNRKFHKSRIDFTHGQENDRRKISYALSKGIDIYIIPYWEIENLRSAADVFQQKFQAHNRWKNDDDWREHQKSKRYNL